MMKDYNFFSAYDRKKTVTVDPKSPFFLAFLLLAIAFVLSTGLVVRNLMLTTQLNHLNDQIAATKESKDYIEAFSHREALDTLAEYDKGAEMVLADFMDHNVLGTVLLDRLSAVLPATVTTTNFSLNHARLTATYAMPNKRTGAELLLNLEDSGLFTWVHSPGIIQNEGETGFIMFVECELKAGGVE
jgi:Tfp pilus assembly protein PilN